MYDEISKTLIERKKFVKKIYDGYIFQLYAQYYAMTEMGYEINHLEVRSLDDNKKYKISLPDEDVVMKNKFKQLINKIRLFDVDKFVQTNKEKCSKCNNEELFVEIQGNRRGLYCGKCGKWQKWIILKRCR